MTRTALYVFLYLAAIVAANTTLLYQTFGAYTIQINALLFIAFDMTSRDYLHEAWHGDPVRLLLLIGMGGLLTLLFNAGAGLQIVTASVAAFVISELIDSATYAIFPNRFMKVNGSNFFSAITDSLLFPFLAGFGFSWPIFLGLAFCKIGGGYAYYLLLGRESHQESAVQSGNSTDVA